MTDARSETPDPGDRADKNNSVSLGYESLGSHIAEPPILSAAPANAEIGPARWLRSCSGVDEGLIRQIWPVRHVYTGLGGIVLATSVAAGTSMALAITLAADGFKWYYLVPPIMWGLLVLNLDRWLVASTHGVGRPWKLIPRLVIAILFGIIIAEPVVLWIFNDAIEERILDDRSTEVREAITRFNECNPESDIIAAAAFTSDPECDGFIVDREIPPPLGETFESAEVLRLERELSTLDEQLDETSTSLLDARDRYQREIRGTDGEDTSGRRGQGPIARAIQAEIELLTSERDQILADRTSKFERLSALQADQDSDRAGQQTDQREAEDKYSDETAGAVAEAIAEVRGLNGDSIGLVQRFDALSKLAAEDREVFLARWLLTLFLVAIDSMPIFAKAIGGKTSYDRLYSYALQRAEFSYEEAEAHGAEEQARRIDMAKYNSKAERSVLRKQIFLNGAREAEKINDELEDLYRRRGINWERRPFSVDDLDPGAFIAPSKEPAAQPPGSWAPPTSQLWPPPEPTYASEEPSHSPTKAPVNLSVDGSRTNGDAIIDLRDQSGSDRESTGPALADNERAEPDSSSDVQPSGGSTATLLGPTPTEGADDWLSLLDADDHPPA